ncbi:fatty acid desaturase-domain-containing protein [Mycena floridula]|nr:fatty acid desaturase-domain-containing protein [Mycena floridula]
MGTDEKLKTFTPPRWEMDEIKRAMPASVFEHRPSISIIVLIRDIVMAIALFYAMSAVRNISSNPIVNAAIWLTYWWFQGLVFTGIWVIGHECAHESFLPSKAACSVIGLVCHTFLWTPYFGWKFVHQIHHRHHSLMDGDQHWIPKTRTEFINDKPGHPMLEYLEDTPLVNLIKLVVQQIIGFPLYLAVHVTGPRQYPAFTNHYNPFSVLYMPHQRSGVVFSDLALAGMGYLVYKAAALWGKWDVFLYYGIPTMLVNHWVTMIVYLHHTDRGIPHYRRQNWTYTRGAFATIDRDFLGWQGRFFLHDIAHFHTVHHLFPRMPFYNCELATVHLKELVGDSLLSLTTPVFKSLWENYRDCQFVEDEGSVLFYKDREGRAVVQDI